VSVPILNASGCLDALTAPEVAQALDAFVTKTITPEPREGNHPVRIAETDHGMLNSIGLQGPGIDAFLTTVLPTLRTLDVPLWVSVGGFAASDYASICARLDSENDIEAVELNLSCPNVEEAPETGAEIVAAARAATSRPLYAKLSPATWDIAATARAVVAAGADGLSLVNTIRACAGAVDVPIVAMGGVSEGRHALDLVAAGASAVALGTVLFSDPSAPGRVRAELQHASSARGFDNPLHVRGIALSS
jgi:dihydroorotate dehydrogenase (NAD+) catalytic subunit